MDTIKIAGREKSYKIWGEKIITIEFHTDPSWLKRKYWGENLSLYQMATLVGISPQGIRYQMVKFGIPRRTLHEARKGRFYGKNHPFWGKHHSPETRRKISETLKGRKPSPNARRGWGWHHSEETRRKLSEGKRGDKNPNWKGGRDSKNRYIHIFSPGHPNADSNGFIPEHRLIMAEYLGRPLKPWEIVHHINGDPRDNRKENLMLFGSQRDHLAFHSLERR